MTLRAWWFWHRHSPRTIWRRFTTYPVVVRCQYGDRAIQTQTTRRSRRQRGPVAEWEAKSWVFCRDTGWYEITGEVTGTLLDDRDRLIEVSVLFPIPYTGTDETFWIDPGYAGEILAVDP